jgi:hypothetical protein
MDDSCIRRASHSEAVEKSFDGARKFSGCALLHVQETGQSDFFLSLLGIIIPDQVRVTAEDCCCGNAVVEPGAVTTADEPVRVTASQESAESASDIIGLNASSLPVFRVDFRSP